MRHATWWAVLTAVAGLWAGSAAASPATSVYERTMPISAQDCMARAASALRAEGYVNSQMSGPTFLGAAKDNHSAVILCRAVPEGVVLVVFVASEGVFSGGIPGDQRNRLVALMGQQASNPPQTAGNSCGWVDGFDQRLTGDIGRGVTNPDPHRNWALSNGASQGPDLFGQRLTDLRACLPPDSYARLYADASVLIARYGRARLGWVDGQDGRWPNDSGKGVSNWQAHYDYAARGGAGQAPAFIRQRAAEVIASAPRDVQAEFYAELSVLIARYGVGR